jgi:hypothetical protein
MYLFYGNYHNSDMLRSFRICVVTIASRHPVLSNGKVVKVDFQVSKNVNRLENKVSGKGKKGAQNLLPMSPLCEVTCSTGEKYTLYRSVYLTMHWCCFNANPSLTCHACPNQTLLIICSFFVFKKFSLLQLH